MRKEFEMTDEDYLGICEATKPIPKAQLERGDPLMVQKRGWTAWTSLGQKMGFKYLTVEPLPEKGERFFTAETRVPTGVVIRFDGPPGHEGGRFVEVERDGESIGFGRWSEHGGYWFLAIQEELDAVAGASPEMFLTLKGAREVVARAEQKRPEGTAGSFGPSRIKELRALCDGATAGPWRFGHSGPCGRQYFACNVRMTRGPIGQGTIFRVWERGDESQANAKFAAAARTGLPEALDAVEERDREIVRLRHALTRVRYYCGQGQLESADTARQIASEALGED